jgi:putative 4-mercaptohistidine N1-methyltranferase
MPERPAPAANPYESGRMVHEYLLFHYGTADQVLPGGAGPRDALDFPARCAALAVARAAPDRRARALDLGCATGRSSFELAAAFDRVVGIDFSRAFVEAALALRAAGHLQAARREEGDLVTPVLVSVPPALPRGRVEFERGDAADLRADLGDFDAVLLANLICRMSDPAVLLARLPGLVRPGGVAVVTTPCTWLEEFTPREKWLGGIARDGRAVSTLDGLRAALEPAFALEHTEDLPFLIREHARKFQWSVAQASVWRRAG